MEMMLVYPNKMDFPIMEDFGIAPPPVGMLQVTVRNFLSARFWFLFVFPVLPSLFPVWLVRSAQDAAAGGC